MRRRRHHATWSAPLAAAMALTVTLAGCATTTTPATTPAPSPAPSPSIEPSALPTAPPTLDPQGTAEQNLAYFTLVGHELFDKKPNSKGKTIVNHFVAAGFTKKDMEVTPDKTAVGLDAANIEFSVRINGGCLVGQAGNTGYHTSVFPILASGHCLIGKTRKITW